MDEAKIREIAERAWDEIGADWELRTDHAGRRKLPDIIGSAIREAVAEERKALRELIVDYLGPDDFMVQGLLRALDARAEGKP